VQRKHPKYAIMHDWWLLIVMTCVGEVVWTNKPEIDYRIHSANAIGPTPKTGVRCRRYISTLKNRTWAPILQVREVYDFYGQYSSSQNIKLLRNWLERSDKQDMKSRFLASLVPHRLRSDLMSDILIRLSIFVNRG